MKIIAGLICCLILSHEVHAQNAPAGVGAVAAAAIAQPKPADALLTVDRIYSGNEFNSQSVSATWLAGHGGYLATESTKAGNSIVSTDPATGAKTTLVAAEDLVPEPGKAPLAIEDYAFTKKLDRVLIYTNSKRVWRQNTRGDYWVLDRSSLSLKKLGGDAEPSTLMFAKFSPDGSKVAYVRERNIFVEHLDNGTIKQITETPTAEVINGTFDWVYEEELGLRDGFRWSPDGKVIAYWRIDTTGVHQFPLVNNTAGLYPEVQWFAYPKTGQQNPICQLHYASLETRSKGVVHLRASERDQRDHYIARMDWVTDPKQGESMLFIQELNRLQNTNRILLAAGFTDNDTFAVESSAFNSGHLISAREIHRDTDDAWVDVHDETFWMKDGRFTWISEKDGWRHVYLVPMHDNKQAALLTPGEFDVIQLLHLDAESGAFYFLASPDDATQSYLYSSDLSANMKRLSPADQAGTHSYNISPDGHWAIHSWSSINSPPVTELVSLPDHKTVRVLQDNKELNEKLKSIELAPVEMLKVDIGNGVEFDGWCITPPKLDPAKKYPVLIYVYGEPAGQTVLDKWGGSSYLWHAMLAQKGYVVMSFDNRGTPAPKGRAWRKHVYRQVGIISPQDQADALKKVLADRKYLDAKRVGIWGWSGGGSSTLQAMFKHPDLYHTGISVAPVPNQRYYDTIYQERYMGLPSDNFEGYRNGSAMNFAEHLKGNLLLIHGTGDDNCHYQTSEMLINELIKHNKQFSMFAYPNRTHSIKEGNNTTRHLRGLMTTYLLKNLSVE